MPRRFSPRELRRVPHGPVVDAAAHGDQADAHQRALGHDVDYERPIPRTACARRASRARRATGRRGHNETMRVKYRYADDAKSTENRTTLQLHTGTGAGLARRHGDRRASRSRTGVAKGSTGTSPRTSGMSHSTRQAEDPAR